MTVHVHARTGVTHIKWHTRILLRGHFVPRRLLHIVYDYLKINGTREALLDFNDLLSDQLKNDNVQGFDTKWDEVLLSMTEVPDEDTLEKVYKKQVHHSEDLKPLMALYQRDTVQIVEAASYSRLKEVVRQHVEQKIRDKSFNARNEERSIEGAEARQGNR